jgi:hypothetical protein
MSEPVALRYEFDGHGYLYMDAGSGSDWASRVKDCEFLYTHPPIKESLCTNIDWLERCIEQTQQIAHLHQEINNLKKQINQLSVSREPKIGDRVILLDDESEGIIESLSIAGGPRINFDDGCYGNYTKVELITLFAYKESERT